MFIAAIAPLSLLPYLKIVGGLALLYIAAKLPSPDEPARTETEAAGHLWRAVGIIAVADVVMSLDNVIAIAAVADGDLTLLALGLGLSIPVIVAGAALIVTLLDRFPLLIWPGAALLGWMVGGVIATDPVPRGYLTEAFGGSVAHEAEFASAAAGVAVARIGGGLWPQSKRESEV